MATNSKQYKGLIIGAVIFVVALMLNPFVIIPAGHRGVVLRFAAIERVMGDGLGLRIPLIESVRRVEVRTVKFQVEADAASKDIQMVRSEIALNYHLDPKFVDKLYNEVGTEYESKIIVPAIQETVKAVMARFVAQDLIEKRELVSEGIRELLTQKLNNWNIISDAFSIMNFTFSAEFEKAVEAKQVAQQEALEQKNVLEKVKYEADQKVERAQAEATSIRISAEAISKQGGKDYVALKWIEKWNGTVPSVTAGSGTGMIMNFSEFLSNK